MLMVRDFDEKVKRWTSASMTNFSKLHLRTLLLLPVVVVLGPVGNVLLGKGMKGVEPDMKWSLSHLWTLFIRIFTSGYIWVGIASLLTFYLVYMLMLTWADYSYLQPVTALSYVVVGLLGYFWLGEAVVPLRWLGIGIICGGVLIIATTPHRTHGSTEDA
jgi:uncharacterized membrane protein